MNWIELNDTGFPLENISYTEITAKLTYVVHLKDGNILHISADEYDFVREKLRMYSNSFNVY